MITEDRTHQLKQLLCQEVEIEKAGIGRYEIHTPFTFDDGDHYVCVLKKFGAKWQITDEGHTYMHMSYEMQDFLSRSRARVIEDALGLHGMECNSGVLSLEVGEDEIHHGIYSFVQALTKISGVTKITREFVKTTFLEDFKQAITVIAGSLKPEFNWHDEERDKEHLYGIDCRIIGKGERPWMVHAVNTSNKCQQATISSLKMEQFLPDSRSVAIFENQSAISPKLVSQLTDIAWKSFSSLGETSRIERYFQEEILNGAES